MLLADGFHQLVEALGAFAEPEEGLSIDVVVLGVAGFDVGFSDGTPSASVVTLGLRAEGPEEATERSPWMLGSSPSMTVEERAVAERLLHYVKTGPPRPYGEPLV